jgi:hypothetical protein
LCPSRQSLNSGCLLGFHSFLDEQDLLHCGLIVGGLGQYSGQQGSWGVSSMSLVWGSQTPGMGN